VQLRRKGYASGLTQFGLAIFGTLNYACPEQQGAFQFGKPGVQCDIFAFGSTMYRFFCAKSPLSEKPGTTGIVY
jgi:hypothetical protein